MSRQLLEAQLAEAMASIGGSDGSHRSRIGVDCAVMSPLTSETPLNLVMTSRIDESLESVSES